MLHPHVHWALFTTAETRNGPGVRRRTHKENTQASTSPRDTHRARPARRALDTRHTRHTSHTHTARSRHTLPARHAHSAHTLSTHTAHTHGTHSPHGTHTQHTLPAQHTHSTQHTHSALASGGMRGPRQAAGSPRPGLQRAPVTREGALRGSPGACGAGAGN